MAGLPTPTPSSSASPPTTTSTRSPDVLKMPGHPQLACRPQHCAYPPQNVQLLLDAQATQMAIRQALADLAARATRTQRC